MVTKPLVFPDTDPTPEFEARCAEILQRWQRGKTPTQQALAGLKTLEREAAHNTHAANQGCAEHFQGNIQHYTGNFNVSITHYDNARRFFTRANNRRRIAAMDLNQGENYRYKGEFKRARHLYRSAYETAAKLGNKRLQAMAVVNEGLVLISLGEYEAAQRALTEGHALSKQWKQENKDDLYALQTEIHHGLATIELAHCNVDAAWRSATLALAYAHQVDRKLSIGYAYHILGDVFTELESKPENAEFDNPDAYYRAALKAFREIDAETQVGRTLFSYARSLAKRGRRRNAAQLFQEAMVIFTRLGMSDDAGKAAEAQLAIT